MPSKAVCQSETTRSFKTELRLAVSAKRPPEAEAEEHPVAGTTGWSLVSRASQKRCDARHDQGTRNHTPNVIAPR